MGRFAFLGGNPLGFGSRGKTRKLGLKGKATHPFFSEAHDLEKHPTRNKDVLYQKRHTPILKGKRAPVP